MQWGLQCSEVFDRQRLRKLVATDTWTTSCLYLGSVIRIRSEVYTHTNAVDNAAASKGFFVVSMIKKAIQKGT